jgi:hypothetical protein
VLIPCDVTDNVLDVAARRHKCISPHGGVAAEKRHVVAVVVEQLFIL